MGELFQTMIMMIKEYERCLLLENFVVREEQIGKKVN